MCLKWVQVYSYSLKGLFSSMYVMDFFSPKTILKASY